MIDSKMVSKLQKIGANVNLFCPQSSKPPRRRLEALLESCIEAEIQTFNALKPTAHAPSQLQLEGYKVKVRNVVFEDETQCLVTHANYTIAYKSPHYYPRDYLVIVMTESPATSPDGSWDDSPLLAYMEVVHRNCKDRGEQNTVVRGILTNSVHFQFGKISNDSRVSFSSKYSVCVGSSELADVQLVVGYIRYILRSAAQDCRS